MALREANDHHQPPKTGLIILRSNHKNDYVKFFRNFEKEKFIWFLSEVAKNFQSIKKIIKYISKSPNNNPFCTVSKGNNNCSPPVFESALKFFIANIKTAKKQSYTVLLIWADYWLTHI